MDCKNLLTVTSFFVLASAFVVNKNVINSTDEDIYRSDVDIDEDVVSLKDNAAEVFNGVYSECFLYLSYTCVQKKTLLYLKELDKLSEVSVIGEYVKFVKLNNTETEENDELPQPSLTKHSDELSFLVDEAVDKFFNNHILKFSALGRDITVPQTVDKFVGRKRKGGGGGGGGGGGHGGGHGGDDGGKKKMMMMAMMCMKMKLMMMVPAMMGMMGMMSFKGMMFSMMSFMISKMMLLMKILEKKGGGGGIGGGDGGWAAGGGGGGGGGAWMPAGGQDYGGGGGGYDANGQWQSRSIDTADHEATVTYIRANSEKIPAATSLSNELVKISHENIKSRLKRAVDTANREAVETSYVKPAQANKSFSNKLVKIMQEKLKSRDKRNINDNAKHEELISSVRSPKAKNEREISLNNQLVKINHKKLKSRSRRGYDDIEKEKHSRNSRTKRGIVDVLQNAYAYWMNRMLGVNNNRRFSPKYPKYKVVQGVKYVYYPLKYLQKMKTPKEINNAEIKPSDGGFKPMIVMGNTKPVTGGGFDPIVANEDFNKGEIVEAPIESRSLKKMKKKMKDFSEDVSAVIEENPWE